jgi:hypothetical protein
MLNKAEMSLDLSFAQIVGERLKGGKSSRLWIVLMCPLSMQLLCLRPNLPPAAKKSKTWLT